MFFISSKTSPALYTYYPIMNQEEFNNIIVSPRHQYDVLYGLGQDANANTSHCKAEDEFSSSFFTADQKNKKQIMITSSNVGTTKSHSISSRQCVYGGDQDQSNTSSSSSSSSIVSWFDIGKVTTSENSTSKTRRFITSSTTKKSQTSQKKDTSRGKAFKKTRNSKKLGNNNKCISTTTSKSIVTHTKNVSNISSHYRKQQQQQQNISSYSTSSSNVSTSRKRTSNIHYNNDNVAMKYFIKRFKETVCIHNNDELYHSNKALTEKVPQQMTNLNSTIEKDGKNRNNFYNNCPSLQSEKDDHCTSNSVVVLSRARQNVVTPTKSNIVVNPMIAFPSSVINLIQHNLPLNIQLYIVNKPKNSRNPKVIFLNNNEHNKKCHNNIVCLKHKQTNWTTATTLFLDIRYYINTYVHQSSLSAMPNTSTRTSKHDDAICPPSCLFFTRKEMKKIQNDDSEQNEHDVVDLVEVRGNISWQRMINTVGRLLVQKKKDHQQQHYYVEMDLVVVVNNHKNNNKKKLQKEEDVGLEEEEEEDLQQLMAVKKRFKSKNDDDSSWIPNSNTSSVESHIIRSSKKKLVPIITKKTISNSAKSTNNRKDEHKKDNKQRILEEEDEEEEATTNETSIIYHDNDNNNNDDDDDAVDTMSFVSFSGSTISDVTIDFGTTTTTSTTTTTTTTTTEQPKLINHPNDEVSSITPEMVVSYDSGLKQKTQNNAIDTEWKNKNINNDETEKKKKQSIYNNNNNNHDVMIHIIREDDETIQDCSIVSMDYNLKQMLEHFMNEDPFSTLFINDLEPISLVLLMCRGNSSDTSLMKDINNNVGDNDNIGDEESYINTIYIKKEKFQMFTLKYLIDTVGLSYGRTIYFKLQYYYNNGKAKSNKIVTTANI